jgi:hypothetical protein
MATESRTTVPLFPTDAEDSVPTKPPRSYARTSWTCTLDPDLLTPPVTARAVGVHPKTLGHFHRLGIGPPRTKIGRRVYYNKNSLLAWLRSREEKPVEVSRGRPRRQKPAVGGI